MFRVPVFYVHIDPNLNAHVLVCRSYTEPRLGNRNCISPCLSSNLETDVPISAVLTEG